MEPMEHKVFKEHREILELPVQMGHKVFKEQMEQQVQLDSKDWQETTVQQG